MIERNSLLTARALTKKVTSPEGELTILNDASLAVNQGETAAVVGPSGAGKSTLLSLLAGLDEPTSGQVWLNGVEVTGLDEDGRARLRSRHVGFVFQSFHLLPSLTAFENVLLPLELGGAPDQAGRATEALGRVGLDERLHHYPRQFVRRGEAARLQSPGAFVTGPSLLFADEPTGNLDNVHRRTRPGPAVRTQWRVGYHPDPGGPTTWSRPASAIGCSRWRRGRIVRTVTAEQAA